MIAVIGGSFDPVHKGHIHLAKYISRTYNLDVYFVPAKSNPLKPTNPMAPAHHRKKMLELSIKESRCNKLFILDYEIKKRTPSYTINTVKHLIRTVDRKIFLVIGSDVFLSLPKWHNAKKLVSMVHFLIIKRKELGRRAIKTTFSLLGIYNYKTKKANINRFEFKKIKILPYSSTQIRKQIKEGKKPEGIFGSVWEYIKKNRLYSV